MADVAQITQRVLDVSRVYQEVAGALLNRAETLRAAKRLDAANFNTVHEAYESILAHAADMLVELDDELATRLDKSLAGVEKATAGLKQSETQIAKAAKIVQVAATVLDAAAAVAIFVAAPSVGGAEAAAKTIAGAVTAATAKNA